MKSLHLAGAGRRFVAVSSHNFNLQIWEKSEPPSPPCSLNRLQGDMISSTLVNTMMSTHSGSERFPEYKAYTCKHTAYSHDSCEQTDPKSTYSTIGIYRQPSLCHSHFRAHYPQSKRQNDSMQATCQQSCTCSKISVCY